MSGSRITNNLAFMSVLLLIAGMAVASYGRNADQGAPPAPDKPQQEPVRVDNQIHPPNIVHRVNPIYPEEAKARGLQTRVIIELTVNEKGQVYDAKVTDGHPMFNDAALAAVRQWRFTPATKNGTPVPVVISAEIKFSLDSKAAEAKEREPIRVGTNVQAAKILTKVDPEYPQEASDHKVQGDVILQVTVSKEGNVSDAKILRGHPLLSAAALNAVKQWKYAPTVLNGEPVPVMATVTISFKLE